MRNIRSQLIWVHLVIASFSIPFILLVAISGGLYLAGFKGNTTSENIPVPEKVSLNFESDALEDEVRLLISSIDEKYDFEQIRVRSSTIQTRPTTRAFYEITQKENTVTLVRQKPNLQSSLMEFHKGHGPKAFKLYQQILAVGLIFILFSGVTMGLSNRKFRAKTALMLFLGGLVFVLLGRS